jgi:predicted DNA-binding ribbon-helix-helix protein
MSDTSIKVPVAARDHLAQLARERGTTIGQLVTELSMRELTADQIAERIAETRKVLRERLGGTLTDEEFDSGPDVLANVLRLAAEKARERTGRTEAA